MSEQRKVAEALQPFMVPGRRYRINELIELLPRTDYVFSDLSRTPINSEPGRPRWNRWVRNAVRNSPDRTDFVTNWWDDLRAEWVGPKKPDWDYWIEIDAGAVTSEEERTVLVDSTLSTDKERESGPGANISRVLSDEHLARVATKEAEDEAVKSQNLRKAEFLLLSAVEENGLGALLESEKRLYEGHWWSDEAKSEDVDTCIVYEHLYNHITPDGQITVLFQDGVVQDVPEDWVRELSATETEIIAADWHREQLDRDLSGRIATTVLEHVARGQPDSHRPANNDGWLAEKRVRELLTETGWTCYDVSREGVGFDILARGVTAEGPAEMFVEVKSSVSKLSGIDLTANEWRAAVLKGESYFIAYFDDFTPGTEQKPSWIRNPSKIEPTERQVTSYFLPRSKWH